MAKRMKSKIQPSELTMTFELIGGKSYIDLSQCASLVNRRFYRQGLNWAVADFKFIFQEQPSSGNGIAISVSKLPNTWVMSNAWEKGFRAWMRQQKQALEENPSAKPKFLDFKIHADADHRSAGFSKNLLPATDSVTVGSGNYAVGEWAPSKVYTPSFTGLPANVNGFDIKAIGANDFPNATVSLIEGYASSRALPNIVDPNLPSDIDDTDDDTPENWITAMFNEGTGQDTEILVDMQSDNNQAPYPYEGDGTATDTQYPGGANNASGMTRHDTAFITSTTIGGVTHLKGGSFPCGLIKIDTGILEAAILQITLVPGNHRGYLCESMVEM